MLKPLIQKITNKLSLTFDEAQSVANFMMTGEASPEDIKAFLLVLNTKGETVDEIAGFATAMRENMLTLTPNVSGSMVDTCGTGADGLGTFNISTVVAFVVTGAGITVAKHGNRAISSKSGSADVLKELGVNINVSPEQAQRQIEEIGMAFLFAPLFHPAMRHVEPVRKELGVRTVFNILGPLCNPAGVKRQVIGVFSKNLLRPLAEVLKKLGSEHVLLVHGQDGGDEISLCGSTDVVELLPNGEIKEYIVSPSHFGLSICKSEDIEGGDAVMNAGIAMDILKRVSGPQLDIVLLNAAAVIYVSGLVDSLQAGLKVARSSVESGHAMKTLVFLQKFY